MTVAEPTASDSADHRIVEHDMTEVLMAAIRLS